jgi:hypothetical protein
MTYSFRFFRDRREYFEGNSLQELRDELRAYCPWNTVFRAIAVNRGQYVVLRLSPYLIGPDIEGYLTTPEYV